MQFVERIAFVALAGEIPPLGRSAPSVGMTGKTYRHSDRAERVEESPRLNRSRVNIASNETDTVPLVILPLPFLRPSLPAYLSPNHACPTLKLKRATGIQ